MSKIFGIIAIALVMMAIAAHGQFDDYHTDYCNPAIPGVVCNSIVQTHDGFCNNISGADGSFWEVDCKDASNRSPREYTVECGTDVAEWSTPSNPACWGRATVLCPTPTIAGNYETFQCYGKGARSGFLGYDGQGRPKRGVECTTTGGQLISCGCVVTSPSSHAIFGNATQTHAHDWTCN